jgi:hypothetical protein
MTFRRRDRFPGVSPQATAELIALQDDLLAELSALRVEAVGQTTDTKQTGVYPCRFNERVRCLPRTAGLDLTFPGATSQTQNKWIEVLKLGGADVRIRATSGTVQGAAQLTLTAPGFYYFQSDGQAGWWIQPSGGGGGGEDLAATLALGNTTGATDISVNAGQRVDFAGGSLAGGDIRGASGLLLAATTGTALLQSVASVAGVVGQTGVLCQSVAGNVTCQVGGANSFRVLTTAVERLEIEGGGAWQLGGVVGAAGQVITSAGAGAPPVWANNAALLRAPQFLTASNAAFAHPTGTKFIVAFLLGGGGGGGGAAVGAGAGGNGGNGGSWGWRTFTSISGTSNVTIGAVGTVGSGAAGGTGGVTSVVHNAVTASASGGVGGALLAAGATLARAAANAANAANVGLDFGVLGEIGQRAKRKTAAAIQIEGGTGGSSPYGEGGFGNDFGAIGAGEAASGRGAGGGGAANPVATAQTGGAATAGLVIFWEFG